jgi:acetolactate synthase-1/2/3 large subunit
MTALARAYGADGARVESIPELEAEVRRAAASDRTTVIEVPIDPEENVYPMIPPGMGLKDILKENLP